MKCHSVNCANPAMTTYETFRQNAEGKQTGRWKFGYCKLHSQDWEIVLTLISKKIHPGASP